MKNTTERIAILDGVRAYAILIIMGFHLWQQSWLQNLFPYDLLQPFGIQDFSLTWLPRTGYMFVDVLLLLSGFCLFLPYARQMTDPLAPAPDRPGLYFKKRAARILPCYYLCLLVYLIFFVRPAQYANLSGYWQDIFSHFTLTHTFWPESYLWTKFPTTLWTIAIEAQFYLLFPLLARLFRRFPLPCWAGLSLLAELYIMLFAQQPDGGADAFHINQLPAFLGVYANGMLAAVLWCHLHAQNHRMQKRAPLAATLLCAISFITIICMLRDGLDRASVAQRWQVDFRFLFSAVACVFILSLGRAYRAVQWLFANRATAFTALISYNLYIWHQPILLQSKAWRFPAYPDAPDGAFAWPQSANGEPWHFAWQVQYTVFFWIAAFLLAALATYFVEKPLARFLLQAAPKSTGSSGKKRLQTYLTVLHRSKK